MARCHGRARSGRADLGQDVCQGGASLVRLLRRGPGRDGLCAAGRAEAGVGVLRACRYRGRRTQGTGCGRQGDQARLTGRATALVVKSFVQSGVACVTLTRRSRSRRTASLLNSRLNRFLWMVHLRHHMTPNLGVNGSGNRPICNSAQGETAASGVGAEREEPVPGCRRRFDLMFLVRTTCQSTRAMCSTSAGMPGLIEAEGSKQKTVA